MPIGLAILLIVSGLIFGWLQGYKEGTRCQKVFTDYWYKEYKVWFEFAMRLLDDDDDGEPIPEIEPEPEPVKAIAKAAGVGR